MLQRIDPDREVILQKDSEGNGYSPLSGIDYHNLAYLPECTWAGEVVYETDNPEATPCVLLIPIN